MSNRPTRRPFDGRTDERTPRRAAAPRKPRTESAFVVVVRSFVRSFVRRKSTHTAPNPKVVVRPSFVVRRSSSFVVKARTHTAHPHVVVVKGHVMSRYSRKTADGVRRLASSSSSRVVSRRRHRVASLVHDDTSCPRWSSSSTVRAAPPPIRFIASSTTDEAKGACVPTAHAGVAHVWMSIVDGD